MKPGEPITRVEITITSRPREQTGLLLRLYGNALAFRCRTCGAEQVTCRWDVPVRCSRCGTNHNFRGAIPV